MDCIDQPRTDGEQLRFEYGARMRFYGEDVLEDTFAVLEEVVPLHAIGDDLLQREVEPEQAVVSGWSGLDLFVECRPGVLRVGVAD